MREELQRTAWLLGEEAVDELQKKRVAVFGIGGVGGYVVEALARSGIGTLDLIDSDVVVASNLNRQIIATQNTIGQPKVLAAKERIASIAPWVTVNPYVCLYLPGEEEAFPFEQYDYIVDAVDNVTAKISLATVAWERNIPIISSMGAGNKLHPELFELADLYDTSVCPLARVMRRECKKRGIQHLKVVYSKEEARKPLGREEESRTPASIAFVPSAAGLVIAGAVIRDLIGVN